jgi:secreted trypsin-like serine protease
MIATAFALNMGCSTLDPTTGAYQLTANLLSCQPAAYKGSSIVGGKVVEGGDPDQRLVTMLKIKRDGRDHVCTGTLISDRVILTAAHCVVDASTSDIEASFVTKEGCPVHQLQTQVREIDRFVVHEEFDGDPRSFADVALVLLKEKAPEDQSRIPLLPTELKLTSDSVTFLGFGITDEKQKNSQVLRRVDKSFTRDFKVESRTITVNQSGGSGGFCRGDSGAPLIGEVWGEPYVLGINSANIGLKPGTECQTASLAMSTEFFGVWISEKRHQLESKTWWEKVKSVVSFLD